MSAILSRVVKLIALTANPNENEARNAAMKACEMIREHNLIISEESALHESPYVMPNFEEWLDVDLAAHHQYKKKAR